MAAELSLPLLIGLIVVALAFDFLNGGISLRFGDGRLRLPSDAARIRCRVV